MARTGRIFSVLLGVIFVGYAIYWLMAYDPDEFRGADPMIDTGFFSYYRYHAPLGDFPLDREGSYEFRFKGLPAEQMGLQFYVSGYSTKNRAAIESLTTLLTAEIADADGNVVCAAAGSPAAPAPARWNLMSTPFDAAYWHDGCRDRPFRRETEYLLRVRVQAPDPRTPRVQLRAMLEGGGNELP